MCNSVLLYNKNYDDLPANLKNYIKDCGGTSKHAWVIDILGCVRIKGDYKSNIF